MIEFQTLNCTVLPDHNLTDDLCFFDMKCNFSILHNSALKWQIFYCGTAAHGHCGHAPLSAILIWDKNQSSTLENSISLMRYEYSSERKSQVVGCFQTNPLKVIWSSAANYRAFWAASHLHRAPPPPFPTYPPTAPLSVHHIPSLCFRSLFSVAVLLLRWELTGGHCSPVMQGSRDLSAT